MKCVLRAPNAQKCARGWGSALDKTGEFIALHRLLADSLGQRRRNGEGPKKRKGRGEKKEGKG